MLRWLLRKIDAWLPRNVWLRGFLMWVLVLAPLLAVTLLIALFFRPGSDGSFAGGLAAIVAIIVAIVIADAVLIVIWSWVAPRMAIRHQRWHRPRRMLVCAAINAMGGAFLGILAAFATEEPSFTSLVTTPLFVAAPLAAIGAVSGLLTRDSVLVEVPPALPEYAAGTKSR